MSDLALQKNVTTIRCIFEAVAVQLASLAKRAMKDSGKKIMLFDKKEMIKEIKVFDDDVKVFEVSDENICQRLMLLIQLKTHK